LAVGALGGVYLCGGILPRIQSFFVESDFLSHFRNKGRFSELVQQVPVSLSLAEFPGLTGAAAYLSNPDLP
ncbi:MAG TPA: glucokinase, partial [Limnobacter sp.]|nr:glucokinase [Limnobacter sp.]